MRKRKLEIAMVRINTKITTSVYASSYCIIHLV